MVSDAHDSTEEPTGSPFGALVLMLGTAAMVHLGGAPDPASGATKQDLPQAKQLIDVLDALKVKTAGNLTSEEAILLDNLLFDLRMRYLETAKRA